MAGDEMEITSEQVDIIYDTLIEHTLLLCRAIDTATQIKFPDLVALNNQRLATVHRAINVIQSVRNST
jgi:hypothetical protein